jgi:hypothetical protein
MHGAADAVAAVIASISALVVSSTTVCVLRHISDLRLPAAHLRKGSVY